jgi:hypothetical protein
MCTKTGAYYIACSRAISTGASCASARGSVYYMGEYFASLEAVLQGKHLGNGILSSIDISKGLHERYIFAEGECIPIAGDAQSWDGGNTYGVDDGNGYVMFCECARCVGV